MKRSDRGTRAARELALPQWAPAVALVALTALAYLPALGNGFIWDDDDYVTRNAALRSLGGLWRIWTEPGATSSTTR